MKTSRLLSMSAAAALVAGAIAVSSDTEAGHHEIKIGYAGGFTGYQAVLAVPILAHLAWHERRNKPAAWGAVFAAPALVVVWQIFERLTTGTAPAEVLGGYAGEYGLLLLELR